MKITTKEVITVTIQVPYYIAKDIANDVEKLSTNGYTLHSACEKVGFSLGQMTTNIVEEIVKSVKVYS